MQVFGKGWGSSFLSDLPDILFLELRGILMMSKTGSEIACAGDTLMNGSVCFCTLCSLGLYDSMRIFSDRLEPPRRATMIGLIGLLLVLAVFTTTSLSALSPYHYTVDVVAALLLTLLVYSNPAVAVSAERWVSSFGGATCTASGFGPVAPLSPTRSGLSSAHTVSTTRGGLGSASSVSPGSVSVGVAQDYSVSSTGSGESTDLAAGSLKDMGQATISPCCMPCCWLAGRYFLRDHPGKYRNPLGLGYAGAPPGRASTGSSGVTGLGSGLVSDGELLERVQAQCRHQAAELAQLKARSAARRKHLEDELQREHARASQREAEAMEFAESIRQAIQSEATEKWQAEASPQVGEMNTLLEKEREIVGALRAQLSDYGGLEDFSAETVRLEEAGAVARKRANEATALLAELQSAAL